MTSQRSTGTSRLFLTLVVAAVASLALLLLVLRPAVKRQAAQPDPAAATNLTVAIDNETFQLKDGAAERPAAPGSAATNTLRVVSEPVSGDINGDSRPDAALLLRNDPGGSGVFFYAALAINDGDGSFHATNVVPLGDRIEPQAVDFTDGAFVYRFLERASGQSMSETPTVPASVTVRFDPATGRIAAAG